MEAIWKIYRLPTLPGSVGFPLIAWVVFGFVLSFSVRITDISIFYAALSWFLSLSG